MNENYSLSPKDCIYISDLLSHTDSLIKKTTLFAQSSRKFYPIRTKATKRATKECPSLPRYEKAVKSIPKATKEHSLFAAAPLK